MRWNRALALPWATAFWTVIILGAAFLGGWLNIDSTSPPRYDGAGYAVLAESLLTGQGYREIDHPAAPRHAHFPPGYPACLAAVWCLTGRTIVAAHILSLGCVILATLLGWVWFRRMYAPVTAGLLGMSLAVNWTWTRVAGAVQSEPLFLVLELSTILVATRTARRGGLAAGMLLGSLLAACVLTRHVGLALAAAVGLSLITERRLKTCSTLIPTLVILLFPWFVWLIVVRENTQVALVGRDRLDTLIPALTRFYVQRIPDQLTGPFVEVATVFQRARVVSLLANTWAILATTLLLIGLLRSVTSPRRRLAGLVALTTLALLLVWPFTEAGRFLIPLVPCLLVGATEGLARLLVWLRPALRQPRACAAFLVLAASTPYSAYAVVSGRSAALRHGQAGFDAACTWLKEANHPGTVLTRHPGEVYWLSGRKALSPPETSSESTTRLIEQWNVAYLLVDDERYANAPENALARFVQQNPERVRLVWSRDAGSTTIRIYEVARDAVNDRASDPRSEGGRSPHNGESSDAPAAPTT